LISTPVVSWKLAAERKLLVFNETLEIPNKQSEYWIKSPFSSWILAFIFSASE